MHVAGLAVLLLAGTAQARDLEAPHRWRVGVSTGMVGTLVHSEVSDVLRIASFEPDLDGTVSVALEHWVVRAIGIGMSAHWHRLHFSREQPGDSTTSTFDTFALLVHAVAAMRASPTRAGSEAAIELALGPGLVHWEHRGVATSTVGLTVRMGARVGQGLHGGFAWSVRPWVATTVGTIGPADLGTVGVTGGIELHAGWGFGP